MSASVQATEIWTDARGIPEAVRDTLAAAEGFDAVAATLRDAGVTRVVASGNGASYYVALALWAFGLFVWLRVDRSMDRYALDAASVDEDAAASVGIDVTREKLKVTGLSAALCALGGGVYAQYQMYIGPDTIAGLGVSLNIVFAVIAGGLWTPLGPTVGAVFTQVLSEALRVAIQGSAFLKAWLGSAALALDTAVYGLLLILFIIYMPKGILGTILERRRGIDRRPGKLEIAATRNAGGSP